MDITRTFKRYEKKFVLTSEQYDEIFPLISRELVVSEYGHSTICNIYYDTDNYDIIRKSMEKPIFKEKFRIRSYGVPDREKGLEFAEIKKKKNGVVYKRRVETTVPVMSEFLEGDADLSGHRQIQDEIRMFLRINPVKPKVFIAYDREAYVLKKDSSVRVTFDRNLRWRDSKLSLYEGDYGEPLEDRDRIIMEIKSPAAVPLKIARLLDEHGIYPGSYSKYGTCYARHILPGLTGEKRGRSQKSKVKQE